MAPAATPCTKAERPGSIQVTAEVARRIGDELELSDPRSIAVKGKGEMVTHLIVRRKVVTLRDPTRAAAAQTA